MKQESSKDLTPLIVPSAETLATLGEGWNNCVPVTKPRPQPDYALGFGRLAFSDDQAQQASVIVASAG